MMSRFADQWMPFRSRNPEPDRTQVLGRIRDELLAPLVALSREVSTTPGTFEPSLMASLESTLATARETALLSEEFLEVRDLGDAMESWRAQLSGFQRNGGGFDIQSFGELPRLHARQLRHAHLVVREAIANSLKHASASKIDVIVAPWNDGCAVTVSDDGRGISTSAINGLGMTGMETRIQRAGGEMAVHQKNGTIVEFMIPRDPPTFWQWLRTSRRLETGVAGNYFQQSLRRWEDRVASAGGLEAWFRDWPEDATDEKAPAFSEIAAWLERETAAMGIDGSSRSGKHRNSRFWTCRWKDDIDPLHWLDLGTRIALGTPLLIVGSGPEKEVTFHFAAREEDLPNTHAHDSFLDRIQQAWSEGLESPHEEIASHLHDHLAQELAGEAIQWELAREQSPTASMRATYDRFSHQLRKLAVGARSLSHEVAAS